LRRNDPVSMRWRLRYDQEVNVGTEFILHLVRLSKWNPNALSGSQNDWLAIHFYHG